MRKRKEDNTAEIPKTDYSRIAEYYDKVRTGNVDSWLSKIVEYGRIREKCDVLDVGCGTGRFALGMSATKECMVYALEPSIRMLEQAMAKDGSKRIFWVGGDGQRLPFQDEVFDCVYMTLVIHHVEDKELVLREIQRVLRKSGSCVIVTNSHARIKRHVIRHFPGMMALDLKRFPSIPSLKRLLAHAGLRDVHHHVCRYDRGYVSTKEYLERVRNKYISTLTLLSEDEFQKGFQTFRRKIKKRYGEHIRQLDQFVFVVGRK